MPKLYYTIHPSSAGVVFALAEDAERVSAVNFALLAARTWGEFEKLMPASEYARIKRFYDEYGEVLPTGDAPFAPQDVPGVADGDYPEWLQQEMERVVPVPLLARHGTRTETPRNGSYWHIPRSRLSAMVAELQAFGYAVASGSHLYFY